MSNALLSTQPYKGTRDFYPEDMELRNWFFGKVREVLALAAFDEYNGPMLESLDIYIAKSGEELACQQTYNFTDRGNRRLAVRPEMTPTVARLVAAKMQQLNMPLRWFSIPNLYRNEQPQHGRLREHWQINADIFGCNSYEADLEIINTAISLLLAFGADESMFIVRINNRRFFNDVIRAICNVETEQARKISKVIDRREKVRRDEYEKALTELGLDEQKIEQIEALYSMSVEEATALCPESQGSAELVALFTALKALGLDKYCKFDFGIIRGLDYYTGTVFEVFDKHPENRRAMFGGGRYDNLVGLFVKNANVPGVGFGCGDVTLEHFLRSHELIPASFGKKAKVLVTRFDDVAPEKYTAIARALRTSGIVASSYLGSKKFGKQIEYAVKGNYTHIIIMGGSEEQSGIVKVKDLEKHSETEVRYAELIANASEYFTV